MFFLVLHEFMIKKDKTKNMKFFKLIIFCLIMMFNIFGILPIAFVSTSLRFKDMKLANNVRHQAFPIKAVSHPNERGSKSNIDYKLYASRRMMQLKNMYSPKTYPPCTYCDGTGFIECPK